MLTDLWIAATAPVAFGLFLFGGRAVTILAAGAAAGAAAGLLARTGASAGAHRGLVVALALSTHAGPIRAALGGAVAAAAPRLLPRLPGAAVGYAVLFAVAAVLGGPPEDGLGGVPRPPFVAAPAGPVRATAPTPLALVRGTGAPAVFERPGAVALAALAGYRAEAIGTASAAGPLAAGFWLALRGALPWRLAAGAGGAILISTAAAHAWGERHAPPLFHILSGGFLLALFLAAPDAERTTPRGEWLVGTLFGLGTGVWRAWGPTADGAFVALLVAAAVTAVVERRLRARAPGSPSCT